MCFEDNAKRELKGVLLGKGLSPVLATWNNRLFCFGIDPASWTPAGQKDRRGRVLAWASDDGSKWEALDIKLPAKDVFLLDTCASPNGLYLAYACGRETPSLGIVRFDKGLKCTATAVISPDEANEAGKDRPALLNVRVALVGDKPTVFWEERLADGSTQLVMEQPELTSGDASAEVQTEDIIEHRNADAK